MYRKKYKNDENHTKEFRIYLPIQIEYCMSSYTFVIVNI